VLDADFFRRWMTATAASVDREAEHLTALDSPIGDADHGSNLQRGFTAVTAALEKEAPDTPGAVLTLAGSRLISTVGGASGPLYGTLLRRTGKALGDAGEVSAEQFAEALRAGVEAVMTLGGAAPGDKTMIDTLVPSTRSVPVSPRHGRPPSKGPWRPRRCRPARAGRVTSASAASGTRTRARPRRPC
jgi:dihydroxyacetone kinase-like protein